MVPTQEQRMDEIFHVKFRACPTNFNPIIYCSMGS